eukprot:876849-Rhodomonas_salina.1
MSFNPFGDEGAEKLAEALGECAMLARVDLSFNGLGDWGAGKLAGVWCRCKALVHLDLGSNKISADGARRISAALDQEALIINWEDCR